MAVNILGGMLIALIVGNLVDVAFGVRCQLDQSFSADHMTGLVDVGYEVYFAQRTNISFESYSSGADLIYEICDVTCDRRRQYKNPDLKIGLFGHRLRIEYVAPSVDDYDQPRAIIVAEDACQGEFVRRDERYYEWRPQARPSRAVSPTPVFVSMKEGAGMSMVWTVPVRSVYGVNTIALAGGNNFYAGHEFVKLREFEDYQHAAIIPSMGMVSNWCNPIPCGGTALAYKDIFRYSSRDACWLVWFYPFNKPSYNGDVSEADFKDRTGVVPSTIGAQIYTIDPPTLAWVGTRGDEQYEPDGTPIADARRLRRASRAHRLPTTFKGSFGGLY